MRLYDEVNMPLRLQKFLRFLRKKPYTITAALFLLTVVLSYQPNIGAGHAPPETTGVVLGITTPLALPTPAAKPWALAPAPEISAKSAVVLDTASHTLLLAKRAHERLPPASTTKIATAIVALENYDLATIVTVPSNLNGQVNGSWMGLEPDMQITVGNLLWGLLLNSGNDAAFTLANPSPTDVGPFIDQMNRLTSSLSLSNTHFTNPMGYDDPNHFSSAYDLAVLMSYAMEKPLFREIVAISQRTVTLRQGNRNVDLELENTNQLLGSVDGIVGGKTGYTLGAGGVLVEVVERNGREIIVVVMGSDRREADAENLIEWAYQSAAW